MKALKILGTVLDWLGKNLSHLKTIGIIVLVILFALAISNNGCQRTEIERLGERITGLNAENNLLHRDVAVRDSLILVREKRIAQVQDSLRLSLEASLKLKGQYKRLRTKYDHLTDSLQNIPADSSYDYLIHEAYPFTGQMRYPFNEPQVRGIHLTFLQKIGLEKINHNLLGQVSKCENQLSLTGTLYAETSEILAMERQSRENLEKVIDNQEEIISEQGKQITKERSRKTFWKVATGIVSAIGIGLAL